MKRLCVYLLLVQACTMSAHIFELTKDTLARIAQIETEDLEGSADMIHDVLTHYTIELKAMVYRGNDIDDRGPQGKTSLMLAAQEANSVMVALLLERGADVIHMDDEQFTPLMHFIAHWIIQEAGVWSIRPTTLSRAYQSPEQCIQLLLDAGSELLELALLHVEHIRERRSEDVQAMKYEGLKRLAAQIVIKLNPKSILNKIKRRIKMRRLRTA